MLEWKVNKNNDVVAKTDDGLIFIMITECVFPKKGYKVKINRITLSQVMPSVKMAKKLAIMTLRKKLKEILNDIEILKAIKVDDNG